MNKVDINPAVSVLMCCYNAERWIDEAIASVLSQSFVDFEFIIVDDGSSDKTFLLLNKYADLDSRIILLSKQNSGPGDSRNVGINIARGKWLAIIDADDIWEPARLEKQMNAASNNNKIVYIGSGLKIIDSDGNFLNEVRYPITHDKLVAHLKTARKFPPHSSALYCTDSVRKLGGFRLRIERAEDWDLWLRLSEVGELHSIPDSLVRIRKHVNQISNTENGRRQLVDARVAIVSYWLRHMGILDPVDSDDSGFKHFYSWVKIMLEKRGVYDLVLFKMQFKSCLGVPHNLPSAVLNLTSLALRSPRLSYRFVMEYLFGEHVSHQLAVEWIKTIEIEKNDFRY